MPLPQGSDWSFLKGAQTDTSIGMFNPADRNNAGKSEQPEQSASIFSKFDNNKNNTVEMADNTAKQTVMQGKKEVNKNGIAQEILQQLNFNLGSVFSSKLSSFENYSYAAKGPISQEYVDSGVQSHIESQISKINNEVQNEFDKQVAKEREVLQSRASLSQRQRDAIADTEGRIALREQNEAKWEEGQRIAAQLHKDMKGIGTSSEFLTHFGNINETNAAQTYLAFRNNSDGESLVDWMNGEVALSANHHGKFFHTGFGSDLADSQAHLANKMIKQAAALGIDTKDAQRIVKNCLEHRYNDNAAQLEKVLDGLSSAIMAASSYTEFDRQATAEVPFDERKDATITLIRGTVDASQKALDNQLTHQSGYAQLGEFVAKNFTITMKTKEDTQYAIDRLSQVLDENYGLQTMETEKDFRDRFKSEFGVDYNPTLVRAYSESQMKLEKATQAEYARQTFETDCADLMNKPLVGRIETKGYDEKTIQTVISKEEVFEERFNAIAKYITQDGGVEAAERFFQDQAKLAGKDWNKMSIDEKYEVLQNYAQAIKDGYQADVDRYTDGKGFEAFKQECKGMYKAAFGTIVDPEGAVVEYVAAQQLRAAVTEGAIKTGAAIIITATTGGAGTAALTYFGVAEVADAVSIGVSGNEFDEKLSQYGRATFNNGVSALTMYGVGQGTQMAGKIIGGCATNASKTGQILIRQGSSTVISESLNATQALILNGKITGADLIFGLRGSSSAFNNALKATKVIYSAAAANIKLMDLNPSDKERAISCLSIMQQREQIIDNLQLTIEQYNSEDKDTTELLAQLNNAMYEYQEYAMELFNITEKDVA